MITINKTIKISINRSQAELDYS